MNPLSGITLASTALPMLGAANHVLAPELPEVSVYDKWHLQGQQLDYWAIRSIHMQGFIHTHTWLILWYKHMTTGRINQVWTCEYLHHLYSQMTATEVWQFVWSEHVPTLLQCKQTCYPVYAVFTNCNVTARYLRYHLNMQYAYQIV